MIRWYETTGERQIKNIERKLDKKQSIENEVTQKPKFQMSTQDMLQINASKIY